jgi:hypothetical protein
VSISPLGSKNDSTGQAPPCSVRAPQSSPVSSLRRSSKGSTLVTWVFLLGVLVGVTVTIAALLLGLWMYTRRATPSSSISDPDLDPDPTTVIPRIQPDRPR